MSLTQVAGNMIASNTTFSNIVASNGLYSVGNFNGTFTNGAVLDYTAGLGRLSVGSATGIAFYNGGVASTELMRLDASGNLGLGVTPSGASGNWRDFDIRNAAISGRLSDGSVILYSNSDSRETYLTTNPAAYYYQISGAHRWYTAPSGTAGNAISFTQAMTLDASGNLGIGTSSPANKLHVSGDGSASLFKVQATNTNGTASINLVPNGTGNGQIYTESGALLFSPANTERARIDSSGNLLVGKTATDNSERLGVKSSGSTSSTYAVRVDNSVATAMFMIRDDGYLRSPTTYNLTGGTANLVVDSSGFITRATSSLRYKKDVVDYDKGLAIVNQLRPVYYKSSIAGADGTIPDTQFAGMIAEEIDVLGLSEFVEYGPDGEVESIRYGNMVSLAFKAIQELTARLEALENK